MTIMQKIDASSCDILFLVEDVSRVPACAPESGTLMIMTRELTSLKREMMEMQGMMANMQNEMMRQQVTFPCQETMVKQLQSRPVDQEIMTMYKPPCEEPDAEFPALEAAATHPDARKKQPAMAEIVAAACADGKGFTSMVKPRKPQAKTQPKKKRTRLTGTGEDASGQLTPGPNTFKMVLTYVNPEITCESLTKYIKEKDGGKVSPLEVKDHSSSEWETKRFVVKFHCSALDIVTEPAFWPRKIRFDRRFDRPRRRKDSPRLEDGGS
jgi:hypothetical protein